MSGVPENLRKFGQNIASQLQDRLDDNATAAEIAFRELPDIHMERPPGEPWFPILHRMTRGDSFVVPANHPLMRPHGKSGMMAAQHVIYMHGGRHGKKFKTRKQKDGSLKVERLV